jgi:hypothetical protein
MAGRAATAAPAGLLAGGIMAHENVETEKNGQAIGAFRTNRVAE